MGIVSDEDSVRPVRAGLRKGKYKFWKLESVEFGCYEHDAAFASCLTVAKKARESKQKTGYNRNHFHGAWVT